MLLKSDITEEAFSLMRISGLTVLPSPANNKLALGRLEGLASEMERRNICLGYNFTEKPDLNDSAGIGIDFEYSLACILAFRMFPDFGKGKDPDQALVALSRAGSSFLYAATATPRESQYPSRMPIGSGNTLKYNKYNKFYRPVEEAPNTCATEKMVIGDIDNFTEDFSAYLKAGEDLASYTLEADDALTVTGDAINTDLNAVDYTVQAVGNNDTTASSVFNIKIVGTTSTGRVETRLITFSLTLVEI